MLSCYLGSEIPGISCIYEVAYTCNIHAVSKAAPEVVISFLNRANLFTRVCLFCNFVRNKIYVMEIEMLKPVVLARYL
jgi:hypothetical protein